VSDTGTVRHPATAAVPHVADAASGQERAGAAGSVRLIDLDIARKTFVEQGYIGPFTPVARVA